jgi:hypothetical protein
MTVTSLDTYAGWLETSSQQQRVINAATGSTPVPTGDGYNTGRFRRIRTLISYGGTVTSAEIRLWLRNRVSGVWYRGASTADDAPLTGINEARDWDVGQTVEFDFQVVALTGTNPTVTVDAQGFE